jgi:hypothetical protein
MLGHAVWRSVLLMLLGIFLRSMESRQTYWTFEDTLTQIGLGYTFLFLLAFTSLRTQVIAFVADPRRLLDRVRAVSAAGTRLRLSGRRRAGDWPHLYTGFLAHFNKNSNLSWAFDVWFLNLFPRQSPFLFNEGGWSTLSFIPTLATMMLGMWSGAVAEVFEVAGGEVRGLAMSGVALTLAGLILQWVHLNPIIKRIWTSRTRSTAAA